MIINDFIKLVGKNGNYDEKESKKAIKTVIESIKEIIDNQDSVTFNGFGTFKNVERAPRNGKVPNTLIKYQTGPKRTAKFSPTDKYKKELNK